MSHDQLFRHASVVLHHGGAGTTASVFHAGRPHVIVPHIADQNFFAHEVVRLGCGVKLPRKHWPEQLASRVDQMESRADVTDAARRAQTIVGDEDGPANAVHELERFGTRRESSSGWRPDSMMSPAAPHK
jgi:vancomycin aglycone glucosyltransferase